MRQIKTCQFSAFDGLLQCFVLKFGDFAALGADLVMMTNGKGDLTYFGLTGAAGIGTPGAEGHIEYGMTESNSEEYNIYDLVDQFFIKLMED